MKPIFIISLCALLFCGVYAKDKFSIDESQYEKVVIIDNGTERIHYVPKKNETSAQNTAEGADELTTQLGLVVEFQNQDINIQAFADKYKLSLATVLIKQYYIFKNETKSDTDIQLMRNILKQDADLIKSIKPNWPFKNKAL